jgi:catechol 2,3-dioxygenase-like lactoylglutathione lyase family enzyme
MKTLLAIAVTLLVAAPASAQLSPFNAAGITYGHVHLNVTDIELAKKIFVEHFGGVAVSKGPLQAVKLPNMLVAFRQAEPTAGSQGSVVDHFGFHVKDIEAVKAKWKAAGAGYEVTQEFTGAEGFPNAYLQGPGGLRLELQEKKDIAYVAAVNHVGFIVQDMPKALAAWKAAGVPIEPTENPNEVYLLAPDGIRVEVYGEPALTTPVAMNHIHFYPPDVPGIRRWYVQMFGANPGRRPCVACVSKPRMIETGDLPGINLSFSPPQNAVVGAALPTKGRSIDHIGFDVIDLDGLIHALEAKGVKVEGPVRQVPGTTVRVAFLTDPWGTYIELTENLAGAAR